MSENVITVDDNNFDQIVLNSDIPVLVDFWAEWCYPCKMIAPTIDEIADTYKEKVKVAKLNVDESPMMANRYNIRGIPTLAIFKNGELKEMIVGVVPKSTITQKLAYYSNIIITI